MAAKVIGRPFYIEKSQLLLNNIENINNENTIEFTDESVFSNFYIKDIFHQPYLSLKYNKIIKPDEPEKFYKNYSLNYINIENIMELNFDSNEHQCLNEISHIYHEKEVYIEFKKAKSLYLNCIDLDFSSPSLILFSILLSISSLE